MIHKLGKSSSTPDYGSIKHLLLDFFNGKFSLLFWDTIFSKCIASFTLKFFIWVQEFFFGNVTIKVDGIYTSHRLEELIREHLMQFSSFSSHSIFKTPIPSFHFNVISAARIWRMLPCVDSEDNFLWKYKQHVFFITLLEHITLNFFSNMLLYMLWECLEVLCIIYGIEIKNNIIFQRKSHIYATFVYSSPKTEDLAKHTCEKYKVH